VIGIISRILRNYGESFNICVAAIGFTFSRSLDDPADDELGKAVSNNSPSRFKRSSLSYKTLRIMGV
jgi:hypothetical protein